MSTDALVVDGGTPLPRPEPAAWPPRDPAVRAALEAAFDDGRWAGLADGAQAAFAQRFAAAHGARHGLFLASGTAALLAAALALGLGEGDEVIVPAFTCPTTLFPLLLLRAVPVLVDIDPATLCLSPDAVEAAVTRRTRAVLAVHMYGTLADLDRLAARHDLALIEDCAHVPGAAWRERGVGSVGRVGCFSFQARKTLTAGEGGLVVTSDDALFDRLHRAVHVGKSPDWGPAARLAGETLALNLAATAFQSAVVAAQFDALEARLARYGESFQALEAVVAAIPGVRLQQAYPGLTRRSFNKLCLIFDGARFDQVSLDDLIAAARAEGLPIRRTYGAVQLDRRVAPLLARAGIAPPPCPITETVAMARAAVLDHWWLDRPGAPVTFIGRVLERLSRLAHTIRPARPGPPTLTDPLRARQAEWPAA